MASSSGPVKLTRINLKNWDRLPGPVRLNDKAYEIIEEAAIEMMGVMEET